MKRKKFKSYRALQDEIRYLKGKIEAYRQTKPAFARRLKLILDYHLKVEKDWIRD